ncbi:MAG: tRNA pseudouridine(38-40) synthase TruA [Defluviitaleaceae bacterium]|nr:tRNA pseudouridine(38-40) synthase TruA [Defluviitaleaceae bacterium]
MQILLTISYDGTNYAGWQRQENAVAVQEKIEDALTSLLYTAHPFERKATVKACSRTDAGVHALGQRASFFADDLKIPLDKLPIVINGLLPQDISVIKAEEVSDDFNPQFDAKQKTYIYNYYNSPFPNPLLSRYSAFVPEKLNITAMQKAAKTFVGKHDFAAFCATGGSAKTTVREIFSCFVVQKGEAIEMCITGSGFLYNMVRIIAGTVLYSGLGKISPDDIGSIIYLRDRRRAGKTMPPQGLVLAQVKY